jgi:hypothetical protein
MAPWSSWATCETISNYHCHLHPFGLGELCLPTIRSQKLLAFKRKCTISGERKDEKDETNRKFHRVERYYGRFERSFSIPGDAEDNKVNADSRMEFCEFISPRRCY